MDPPIRRRLPTDPPPEQGGNTHVHPVFAAILNQMCPIGKGFETPNSDRAMVLQIRYGAPGERA